MWAPLPPEVLGYLRGGEQPEETIGWDRTVAKIDEFHTLADDYDGAGAKAPTSPTLAAAAELVREMKQTAIHPPSWVVAGPNGSVNLEWEFTAGVSVSVEVTEPDEADVFLLAPGREPGYWVVSQTAAV